jgi:hypothetical protein
MATRATLLTATRRRIDETDSDNSHFTDAEIYDYINQAIRQMGTDLEWPLQTAEAISVEDQAIYTLPTDFISLSGAYFDNSNLMVIERQDLTAVSGKWQETDAGVPRYAYKSDNAKFGLYPKPSAGESGKIIQIQYIKIPADLSDDTTPPDLHIAFQDLIPFYSAFLCEDRLGNTKKATYDLDLYEKHKKQLLSKVQRFSNDVLRFRWIDSRGEW